MTFEAATQALYRRIQASEDVRHHEVDITYRLSLEDVLRDLHNRFPEVVEDALTEQFQNPAPTLDLVAAGIDAALEGAA